MFFIFIATFFGGVAFYSSFGLLGLIIGLCNGDDELTLQGAKTFFSGLLSAITFSVLAFNFNCSKEPFKCSIEPSSLVVQLIITIHK